MNTVKKWVMQSLPCLAHEINPNFINQKFTNCKNSPSPLMPACACPHADRGEGWGEGAPSPLSPPTRGGEISVFIDVQLSVCKFLINKMEK